MKTGGHVNPRIGNAQSMACPRCPLYLRDSPGLPPLFARRLRFAPSVGQIRCELFDLSPVGKRCGLVDLAVSVSPFA